MVLWYLRGRVIRLDSAVVFSALQMRTQRIVVTPAHPQLPFCGSHVALCGFCGSQLNFGLDSRLRHAENCMSGKQPMTMWVLDCGLTAMYLGSGGCPASVLVLPASTGCWSRGCANTSQLREHGKSPLSLVPA